MIFPNKSAPTHDTILEYNPPTTFHPLPHNHSTTVSSKRGPPPLSRASKDARVTATRTAMDGKMGGRERGVTRKREGRAGCSGGCDTVIALPYRFTGAAWMFTWTTWMPLIRPITRPVLVIPPSWQWIWVNVLLIILKACIFIGWQGFYRIMNIGHA